MGENEGKAVGFLACDDNGVCLESVELLKSLEQVMKSSNAESPDWMAPLIQSTEESKGGWSWGNKDAREGQESNTWNAGGDSWGGWNKDDNSGGNSWEQSHDNRWS